MARIEPITVTLKLDARQFNRDIRRVQRRLWWMRHRDRVTDVATAALIVGAFILGHITS